MRPQPIEIVLCRQLRWIGRITAMQFTDNVLTGLAVGTLAELAGSCQVEFQMRDSRKRPFPTFRHRND